MILAFLLLAGMPDWVPARWSNQPKALELLEGTSVNCILIDSTSLTAELVKSAAQRQIAVVSVIHAGSTAVEQARVSVRFGVNAIALEGDFDDGARESVRKSAVPVIELPSRQKIRLDTNDAIAGTYQGLWPGIVIEHGGKVMAGPSSTPWINTNTGFLRFLHAAVQSALWVGVSPPSDTAVPPERYGIAIADAAAAGARWIITLDDDLRARLFQGDAHAVRDWKQIVRYVRYFEEHGDWRTYRPFSRMALMQDAASGGLLSAGLLDLMYAQHIAAQPMPPGKVKSTSGIRTVINVTGQQRELAEFARSGGVVISPAPDWRFGPDAPGSTVPSKQQLKHIQDIWEMLYNATARKNFGARTFNTAGVLFNVLASPDEKRLVIHLVNYTQMPGDTITVHALGDWKHARLYRPGGSTEDLPVYPVKDGTGVDIDKLDVLATLVVE